MAKVVVTYENVKPIKEVTITLNAEEAKILKNFIGSVSSNESRALPSCRYTGAQVAEITSPIFWSMKEQGVE
jgi:hypothetical protein